MRAVFWRQLDRRTMDRSCYCSRSRARKIQTCRRWLRHHSIFYIDEYLYKSWRQTDDGQILLFEVKSSQNSNLPSLASISFHISSKMYIYIKIPRIRFWRFCCWNTLFLVLVLVVVQEHNIISYLLKLLLKEERKKERKKERRDHDGCMLHEWWWWWWWFHGGWWQSRLCAKCSCGKYQQDCVCCKQLCCKQAFQESGRNIPKVDSAWGELVWCWCCYVVVCEVKWSEVNGIEWYWMVLNGIEWSKRYSTACLHLFSSHLTLLTFSPYHSSIYI